MKMKLTGKQREEVRNTFESNLGFYYDDIVDCARRGEGMLDLFDKIIDESLNEIELDQ